MRLLIIRDPSMRFAAHKPRDAQIFNQIIHRIWENLAEAKKYGMGKLPLSLTLPLEGGG